MSAPVGDEVDRTAHHVADGKGRESLDAVCALFQSHANIFVHHALATFSTVLGALNITFLRMSQRYLTAAYRSGGRMEYEGAKKMVTSLWGMTSSDLHDFTTQFEEYVTNLEIGETSHLPKH